MTPNDDHFIEQLVPCLSRLHRFIATLVPNRADAEDVFQTTCLKAWGARFSFDAQRELFPWIAGIARNCVHEYYRRSRHAVVLDPEIINQLAERHFTEEAVSDARERALGDCLKMLPRCQRVLVENYYRDRFTIQEYARRSGQSTGALYKTIQRIRAALRDCINRTVTERIPI